MPDVGARRFLDHEIAVLRPIRRGRVGDQLAVWGVVDERSRDQLEIHLRAATKRVGDAFFRTPTTPVDPIWR